MPIVRATRTIAGSLRARLMRAAFGERMLPVSRTNRIIVSIFRWPVFWGILATLGFYGLIRGGLFDREFTYRYFDSHPILQVEVAMFFIAAAALILKAFDVAAQFAVHKLNLLSPRDEGGQSVSMSSVLLADLDNVGSVGRQSYLVKRLRDVLLFVQRKGDADAVAEQMRYLSDLDSGRVQSSYGLIRIVVWAIPILGFLGTVVGITMALAAIDPKNMANEAANREMVASLGIAFDTTALALSLTMPLMFAKFYVEQFESKLMDQVDARTDAELLGRFESLGTQNDPQAASIRRMSEQVVAATQQLVERQASLWQSTITAAHEQWSCLATGLGKQSEEMLTVALERSLKSHAGQLAAAERAATEQNRRHWEDVQKALNKNADAVLAQQSELTRQGEVMLKVVDATGHVRQLEEQLNRNLTALAGAKHFEEMVTSLAAAIQLLSARLGSDAGRPAVHLTDGRTSQKAA
jgi:biopolymer transport protein ExbB/TolQ